MKPLHHYWLHTFYSVTRIVIAQHDAKWHRRLFLFDFALFIYSFRILLIAYVAYTNFQLTLPGSTVPYHQVDPYAKFVYDNRRTYDATVVLTIWMWGIFHFFIQCKMQSINTGHISWRWYLQLICVNQDIYHQCRYSDEKVRSIVRKKMMKIATNSQQRSCWYRSSSIDDVDSNANATVYRHSLHRFYCYCRAWTQLFGNLHEIVYQKMLATISTHQWHILPFISVKYRLYIVQLLLVADWINCLFLGVLSLCYWTIFIFLVIPVIALPFGPLGVTIVTIEIVLVYYCLIRLYICTNFFACLSVISSLLYMDHIRAITDHMGCVLQRTRFMLLLSPSPLPSSSSSSSNERNYRLLPPLPPLLQPLSTKIALKLCDKSRKFLHQYTRLTYIMAYGNWQIFGTIIFMYLAINIPINIFLLKRIIFVRSATVAESAAPVLTTTTTIIDDRTIALAIIFMQFITFLTVITPGTRVSKYLYRCVDWMPLYQLILTVRSGSSIGKLVTKEEKKAKTAISTHVTTSSTTMMKKINTKILWYKLKFDRLQHQIQQGAQFNLTIGSLRQLSYRTLFELCLLYIGYLLMMFKYQLKKN